MTSVQVTCSAWTLKSILEFTLSSITGLFNFCISVNLDQRYKLTPQLLDLSPLGLWEEMGEAEQENTQGVQCEGFLIASVHQCNSFHTFSLETLKRARVQNHT